LLGHEPFYQFQVHPLDSSLDLSLVIGWVSYSQPLKDIFSITHTNCQSRLKTGSSKMDLQIQLLFTDLHFQFHTKSEFCKQATLVYCARHSQ
jgi:hypothetical protein